MSAHIQPFNLSGLPSELQGLVFDNVFAGRLYGTFKSHKALKGKLMEVDDDCYHLLMALDNSAKLLEEVLTSFGKNASYALHDGRSDDDDDDDDDDRSCSDSAGNRWRVYDTSLVGYDQRRFLALLQNVNIQINDIVAPRDDYLGKHPGFLGALRPDKTLYMEFLAEFQKLTTYVLDEYKRGSLDLFCSMRPKVLASIRKLKVVYLQHHEVDEMRDRVGQHNAPLGWYFDKDALSRAANVQELTWDISSIYKDLFGVSLVSHIPDFRQLRRFNLVIHNHGQSGEDMEVHEVTDLDHLLEGLSGHFSTLMPKTSRVYTADFEDEPKMEFERAFDNLPSDIRTCLTWLWHRYPWDFEINMQRVLARSRLKTLPTGGCFSDVTCLGVSETWFWEAAEGETLLGSKRSSR
ncbi:hypothetical protein DL98DRAFT_583366 [Cadophora sp. DSE1049]|nr:hypothetical protein DL98DRAFT_583366 [Cadophora sp. DSE1049]